MNATKEPDVHREALRPQCSSGSEDLVSLGLLKPFGGFHFAIFDFSFQTNTKPSVVTTKFFFLIPGPLSVTMGNAEDSLGAQDEFIWSSQQLGFHLYYLHFADEKLRHSEAKRLNPRFCGMSRNKDLSSSNCSGPKNHTQPSQYSAPEHYGCTFSLILILSRFEKHLPFFQLVPCHYQINSKHEYGSPDRNEMGSQQSQSKSKLNSRSSLILELSH